MAIGSSNLSLQATIRNEYDVDTTSAISISQLYRKGEIVPDYIGTTQINTNVPESGTISFSQFNGGSVAGSFTASSTLNDIAPMYWAANGLKGNIFPTNYGIFPKAPYSDGRTSFRGSVDGTTGPTMIAGRDYAVLGNTGAAQTGSRVMWYGGSVSSRGGNSGQGIGTLGAGTLAQYAANLPGGSQIFIPQKCRNNVTFSSGSNPASYVLFCNGQGGTEDAGKGGVALWFFPKKQLEKMYANFGFTFNQGT